MQLIFYSGKDCHLCDLAMSLLTQLGSNYDIHLTKVDVKTDHQLFHLYGARIPVIKREDNQQELGWPFNLIQLKEFLD
ncbi:glutaredoxin family protein [Aliiglaciecola sp. 3_MG-2023]|uniref:glutaredoxin family protein n=1 Tax=Aliiglaciecola sp. 3_MG-2023 TaxID=3062644 RepID=UPI0026E39AC1|nr:glutaredoxin family protein [Aliiglaciecola sp. 3_MG-2023]MDO6692533.1 glutaredoxin family protein [Aliiglaciecola sp. 3_MG-2023]